MQCINVLYFLLFCRCGYHLDMLCVGIMMGVCSVLGLPWCVAATVLCLGHVDSLKVSVAQPDMNLKNYLNKVFNWPLLDGD